MKLLTNTMGRKKKVPSLMPSAIRYSQCSISSKFTDGTPIGQLLDDLYYGRCFVSGIKPIEVSLIKGLWVSADNRRLWVFKQLQKLGRVQPVPMIVKEAVHKGKLTSTSSGKSVEIRSGDPGGTVYDTLVKAKVQQQETTGDVKQTVKEEHVKLMTKDKDMKPTTKDKDVNPTTKDKTVKQTTKDKTVKQTTKDKAAKQTTKNKLVPRILTGKHQKTTKNTTSVSKTITSKSNVSCQNQKVIKDKNETKQTTIDSTKQTATRGIKQVITKGAKSNKKSKPEITAENNVETTSCLVDKHGKNNRKSVHQDMGIELDTKCTSSTNCVDAAIVGRTTSERPDFSASIISLIGLVDKLNMKEKNTPSANCDNTNNVEFDAAIDGQTNSERPGFSASINSLISLVDKLNMKENNTGSVCNKTSVVLGATDNEHGVSESEQKAKKKKQANVKRKAKKQLKETTDNEHGVSKSEGKPEQRIQSKVKRKAKKQLKENKLSPEIVNDTETGVETLDCQKENTVKTFNKSIDCRSTKPSTDELLDLLNDVESITSRVNRRDKTVGSENRKSLHQDMAVELDSIICTPSANCGNTNNAEIEATIIGQTHFESPAFSPSVNSLISCVDKLNMKDINAGRVCNTTNVDTGSSNNKHDVLASETKAEKRKRVRARRNAKKQIKKNNFSETMNDTGTSVESLDSQTEHSVTSLKSSKDDSITKDATDELLDLLDELDRKDSEVTELHVRSLESEENSNTLILFEDAAGSNVDRIEPVDRAVDKLKFVHLDRAMDVDTSIDVALTSDINHSKHNPTTRCTDNMGDDFDTDIYKEELLSSTCVDILPARHEIGIAGIDERDMTMTGNEPHIPAEVIQDGHSVSKCDGKTVKKKSKRTRRKRSPQAKETENENVSSEAAFHIECDFEHNTLHDPMRVSKDCKTTRATVEFIDLVDYCKRRYFPSNTHSDSDDIKREKYVIIHDEDKVTMETRLHGKDASQREGYHLQETRTTWTEHEKTKRQESNSSYENENYPAYQCDMKYGYIPEWLRRRYYN